MDPNTGFTPVKLPLSFEHGSPKQHLDVPSGFTPIKLPTEFGSSSGFSDFQTGFTPIKLPTESGIPESPFTTICMKVKKL